MPGERTTRDGLRRLRPLAPAALILGVQLAAFPVPAGVFLRGLLIGGLTGLLAIGLALTYRSHRVIDFAHAELGVAPVVLTFLLRTVWGWPYAVAAGTGAVAAAALGAVVELAVIRRFHRAPRLVLTVATIGLAQVLSAVALVLPRAFGEERLLAGRLDAPFGWRGPFGGVVFDANDLLAALAVPTAVAAVAVFLRSSTLGIAVRAAADDADRAASLGVPVKRAHTVVWALAGLLAFLAVFLRAGMLGLPVTSALGFAVLLRALAALVIGRLSELGTIVATSLALGVLELGVAWNTDSAQLIDPILALAIVLALVARRRTSTRVDADSSSWRALDEPRPVPVVIRRRPAVRAARWAVTALVSGAAVAAPHVLSVDRSTKAAVVLIYALLGLSVVVLTGWSGQVSLGQIGFFALGACLGAEATTDWGFDLSAALVVAGLVGAVAATAVGWPASRSTGLSAAVTTLAFSIAATSYVLNRRFPIARWVPAGRIERPPLFGRVSIESPTRMYYVVLAVLALVLTGLHGIRSSRTGRALRAVREHPRAAEAFGISAARIRFTGFALAGAVAAIAGCLLAHHQQAVGSQPYAPSENLTLFTLVVVGGVASPRGAVVGAVLLQGSRWLLPDDWRLLASGAGVLAILLVAPGGVGGLLTALRDRWVTRIADRQQIDVVGVRSGRLAEHLLPAPPTGDAP